MSKELTLEEANALRLPYKGERGKKYQDHNILKTAPYYNNGIRGRACCVHVFSGQRWDIRGHRCGKKAVLSEGVRTPEGDLVRKDFCAFHSTEQCASRDARSAEKYAASQAKWNAARELERRKHEALNDVERYRAALEKIAAGDNDPRSTAREALGVADPTPDERF